MSGPKLVGITCDPEVIARNNARLREVGKTIYFRNLFTDVNTDISNEETWFSKYAESTIAKIPKDYGDPNGLLVKIEKVKMQHIEKIEKEKINMNIIRKMSEDELNNFGIQKVTDIPKWKEDFIEDISNLLKELQKDVEHFQIEINNGRLASEKYSKQMVEGIKEAEEMVYEMNKVTVKEMNVDRYEVGEMLFATNMDKEEDPANMPYSFDELALLEMFESDMEEFAKCPYLKSREKGILKSIYENMEIVSEDNKDYPMKSKRSILYQIKLDYQRLSKAVASLRAEQNEERQERSTLVIEYTSFIKALDRPEENYHDWSLGVLDEKVKALRKEVEKQEERIYVEESVEEIMKKYGYSGISSHNLHDADKRSNIIFEDSLSKKISVSFGEGMVMLNVIGEGDQPPTPSEIKEQVKQQEAFCDMYPKIKDELEKMGIHIMTENVEPVSEKHVVNLEIKKQPDIKKTTRRFSLRHMNIFSSDNNLEVQYDTASPKTQYVNSEGS